MPPLKANKSKSLHFQIKKNAKNEKFSEKILSTQLRFFKFKEPKIDSDRNARFSAKKPSLNCSFLKSSLDKKRRVSPPRFYEMEKSDFSRRLRVPACLILKETKYNGHTGLYGKEANNAESLRSYSLAGCDAQKPPQLNIEKQIVKELNLHSIL